MQVQTIRQLLHLCSRILLHRSTGRGTVPVRSYGWNERYLLSALSLVVIHILLRAGPEGQCCEQRYCQFLHISILNSTDFLDSKDWLRIDVGVYIRFIRVRSYSPYSPHSP